MSTASLGPRDSSSDEAQSDTDTQEEENDSEEESEQESDDTEEENGATKEFVNLITSGRGRGSLGNGHDWSRGSEDLDSVEELECLDMGQIPEAYLRSQRNDSWLHIQSVRPEVSVKGERNGHLNPEERQTNSQKDKYKAGMRGSRPHHVDQPGNSKLKQELLKDLKDESKEYDLGVMSCGMESRHESGWSIWTDQIRYAQTAPENRHLKVDISREDSQDQGKLHEDQYPGVSSVITSDLDMKECVGMTHLWSNKDAQFKGNLGLMPLEEKGWWQGEIAGVKVRILQDSGASTSFISDEALKDITRKSRCPERTIHPAIKVEVASGKYLLIERAVNFNVCIKGHVFNLWAYVLPGNNSYHLLLGRKNMVEIEGGDDFAMTEFHFQLRSAPIMVHEHIQVRPGETKQVKFRMTGLPTPFRKQPAVAMWTLGQPYVMAVTRIYPTTNVCQVRIKNVTNKVMVWNTGKQIGTVDLRSAGLFRCDRHSLETMDGLMCLTEAESQQCIQECMDHVNAMVTKEAADERDPYSWLDDSDERKKMTDEEIIRKYVNLDEAKLKPHEKEKLWKMLIKYRPAFSLRDEIGKCTDMKVKIELHDTTPFFIRPYPCTPEHKKVIDREMAKGVTLGVLKKGLSSYSSPVMLVPRPHGGEPRLVTDFRHLNARIVKLNPSIPLVREAVQTLGESECEIFSIVDLKDAYHSMVIEEDSQKYCGITPYSGSPTYLYQRLAMGLSVSPAMWQNFITTVLGEMPNPDAHLAIMDDCLVHTKEKDHMKELERLLQALIRHGLKISPKKCQLFRTSCVYMGHNLLIRKGKPCITPWKTRTDAVMKLNQPKGIKDVRTFCGMVNFLSVYLKDLQITLAPIYDLIKRKQDPKLTGQPLPWSDTCQEAFEKIKKQLTEPPVLSMPNKRGMFELRSDTSKIGCGAILRQDGKLVGYYSKRLKECCTRYSITELELTGMTINISGFKYLLARRYFKVIVDHRALIYIWKAKTEPKTDRLKKLLEVCMGYNFDVSYEKGATMHCADFLSRHPDNDDTDRSQVIPISFEAHVPDWDARAEHSHLDHEQLMVMTRNMQKATGTPLVVPNFTGSATRPRKEGAKKQVQKPPAKLPWVAPNLAPDQNMILPVRNALQEQQRYLAPLGTQGEGNFSESREHKGKPRSAKVPGIETLTDPVRVEYSGSWSKGPTVEENPIPIWDFDEVRKEAANWKWSRMMEKKDVSGRDVVTKQIPHQRDTKILNKIIQNIPLHNFELPITAVQITHEYCKSPFFKDVYKYCTRGISPFTKGAARKAFENECVNYVVIKGLLFKVERDQLKEEVLKLCIPEKYVPIILFKYHDFILAMHQGITRTYRTIQAHYFFPRMEQYVRAYINTCPVCQQRKSPKDDLPKATHVRIPVTAAPFERMAMDVKDMPLAADGSTCMLVCVCEFTNYPVAVPMLDQKAPTIFNAFFQAIVCDHRCPKVVITDKAKAFTGELADMLYKRLRIKRLLVQPANKGANRAERYIQTLTNEIVSVIGEAGRDWPAYVKPALRAFRNFVSPATGFSPYELVTARKPEQLSEFSDLGEDCQDGRVMDPVNYMEYLTNRREMIEYILKNKKLKAQLEQVYREQRKTPDNEPFSVGELVMFENKAKSEAYAQAQKATLTRPWIGPVKVSGILDANKYLLADWAGRIIKREFHRNELKKYFLRKGEQIAEVLSSLPKLGEAIEKFEAAAATNSDISKK